MKKFIVLYHAPDELMKETAALTSEEQAKGMEPWMQWAQQCGEGLVDIGVPLANGQRLSPDGASRSSGMEVVGYSVLQAENMEEAKKLLIGHPHLAWNAGCSIEVHETMPLPGM